MCCDETAFYNYRITQGRPVTASIENVSEIVGAQCLLM